MKATTATRSLEKRIPDKFITERTGHRAVRSLQQYQRSIVHRRIEISKAFDLLLGDKVNTYCREASVRKEVSRRADSVEIGGEIEK